MSATAQSATAQNRPSQPEPLRAQPAPAPPSDKSPWTRQEFAEVWELVPVDVQPLLWQLAGQPDGFPLDELQETFDYPASKIRGMLSEVNRVHKQYRHRPRLFNHDRPGLLFTMDADTAALIRQQPNPWAPL